MIVHDPKEVFPDQFLVCPLKMPAEGLVHKQDGAVEGVSADKVRPKFFTTRSRRLIMRVFRRGPIVLCCLPPGSNRMKFPGFRLPSPFTGSTFQSYSFTG
jgi:hypothetical protein